MKKRILSVCMIIIVLVSCTFCYSATVFADTIEPRYVGTFLHSESFTKGSGAELIPSVYLKPNSEDTFDRVVIRLKITKTSTSTVCYNQSFTTYYNATRKWFSKSVTYTAPSKGEYKLNTTYKCYKDGVLIETINGVEKTLVY